MRIAEIADPQSALGLWKLISDNTWAALEQQAQQQAQEQQQKSAAKATQAKSGGGKRTPARIPRRPRPPATPGPKAQSTQSTAQSAALSNPTNSPINQISTSAVTPSALRKGPFGATGTALPSTTAVLPKPPAAQPAGELDKHALKALMSKPMMEGVKPARIGTPFHPSFPLEMQSFKNHAVKTFEHRVD